MNKIILGLVAICFGANCTAQTFTNMSSILNSPGGGQPCVADMNSDGLDDIVSVAGSNLIIDYQQADGTFSETTYNIGLQNNPSWSIQAGDIDKNGYNDLMLGGGQRVSFVYANADGTGYTEDFTPYEAGDNPFIFSQRVNFADINNDGHLDAFACHDIDQSHPYRNDGNGVLTEDVSLLPTVDITGNYASVFVDFDNDGDTDMYLTKCSGGSSAGQPANQNGLYVNDGNGNFTVDGPATAQTYGLFDGERSWVTIFEDFDNDGDFDAYTVNHSNQNFLRENDGTGHYTDISTGSGINLTDLGSWGCIGADLDNDGFIDILSDSDTNDEYYHNNGDFTFTSSGVPFNPRYAALGDLNNDGFIDVWTGGGLYMNDGNANNWSKVCLEGVASNRNGIGAKVKITGSWGTQTRECRAGEGFHPGNTLDVNFGIGTASSIDNITVEWPSGQVDVINNPPINTRLVIVEGLLEVPAISLSLKVALGGAYDEVSGLMSDNLRSGGDIPLEEPYTGFGFSHIGEGGGETTTNTILNVTGDDAVVDWMFVEIRNGSSPSQVLATKSVLVKRNGMVMDSEGNETMTFNVASGNNFLVALRHRNHLGIRNFVSTENQDGLVHFIDFTDVNLTLYGVNPVNVVGGVNVLIPGNANGDVQINSVDKNNFWRPENAGSYDYLINKADFNLDGEVNASDKNSPWRINNTKIEQLD